MPRFIELVSRNVVDANRWFKNGDHPDDYAHPIHDSEGGKPFVYSSQHQRIEGWEGQVVRYFRDPSIDGRTACGTCGHVMHVHHRLARLERYVSQLGPGGRPCGRNDRLRTGKR